MNRYTIHCTKAQIKKALELGAPIDFEQKFSIEWKEGTRIPYPDVERDEKGEPIPIPVTAEQMIGWLKDMSNASYDDYKKSILAAVDAALEYLSKNKK